jgi:hypothetical protein
MTGRYPLFDSLPLPESRAVLTQAISVHQAVKPHVKPTILDHPGAAHVLSGRFIAD